MEHERAEQAERRFENLVTDEYRSKDIGEGEVKSGAVPQGAPRGTAPASRISAKQGIREDSRKVF